MGEITSIKWRALRRDIGEMPECVMIPQLEETNKIKTFVFQLTQDC